MVPAANTPLDAQKSSYRLLPRIITFSPTTRRSAPITPRTPVLLAALASLAISAPPAHAQCTDAHYRWTVKTRVAHEGDPWPAATPAAMLTWTPLELYHPAPQAHDCTPRADRELSQGRTTKSGRCVVVEIPDPQYGTVFRAARQSFLDLSSRSVPQSPH